MVCVQFPESVWRRHVYIWTADFLLDRLQDQGRGQLQDHCRTALQEAEGKEGGLFLAMQLNDYWSNSDMLDKHGNAACFN